MSEQDNLQAAKDGYAAFSAGDAEKAMEHISDDIEWVVNGNSSISGTKRGKQEVGEYWGQLAGAGFTVEPQFWFADGNRVAVFSKTTVDGTETDTADLLTYNDDGQLIKYQSAGDPAALDAVFS